MINIDGEPATGELPDRHASLTGSRRSAFTTGPKARTPADRLVARPHSGIPVSRAARRSGAASDWCSPLSTVIEVLYGSQIKLRKTFTRCGEEARAAPRQVP